MSFLIWVHFNRVGFGRASYAGAGIFVCGLSNNCQGIKDLLKVS